ncbi:MAG: helix-turn-helix domain-containing protein [Candidatus Cryptobacteroides sp.]
MGKIRYLRWMDSPDRITPPDHRIGTDLLLIDADIIKKVERPDGPFMMDVTSCYIYSKGWSRIMINMKEYVAEAPCILILLSGQIFETVEASEDVEMKAIVMSKHFLKDMFASFNQQHLLLAHFSNNPVVNLPEGLDSIEKYYSMMLDLLSSKNICYKMESARHLTLSMFYSFGMARIHATAEKQPKRHHQEEVYSKFVKLLRRNYKEHRSLQFYADKLCITVKYLSQLVKTVSGHKATEVIDSFVITEAKALLSSTDMSISEIAMQLNFPSLSVFGKFFKRVSGYSPKDYRNRRF